MYARACALAPHTCTMLLICCIHCPQLFLEGLLRRFLQEADHLLGMTSDDADKVREAEAAALREAKVCVHVCVRV